MTKSEAFEILKQTGLKQYPDWQEYERGKRILRSNPMMETEYDFWLKILVEYLGVRN
jgi:hypothetical protein